MRDPSCIRHRQRLARASYHPGSAHAVAWRPRCLLAQQMYPLVPGYLPECEPLPGNPQTYPRTAAYVSAIQLDSSDFRDRCFVIGAMRFGDNWFHGGDIVHLLEDVAGIRIRSNQLVRHIGPRLYIIHRLLICRYDAIFPAGLDGHVRERHPLLHRQIEYRLAIELQRTVRSAFEPDVTNDAENQIFGHQPGGSVPSNTKRIVSGTFTQIFPVPMINAASVLPTPWKTCRMHLRCTSDCPSRRARCLGD